jgi:hypothetical protein
MAPKSLGGSAVTEIDSSRQHSPNRRRDGILKNSILATVIVAATSWSATPVQFTSGQPAKASEVNQNFAYMDSAISKKANRTSLDSLGALLKAKPDTSTVNTSILNALVPVNASLRGKVDTGSLNSINASLRTKADTGALTNALAPLKSKLAVAADTAWVSKKVSDAQLGASSSGSNSSRFVVQAPTDIYNNAPWYGLGLNSLTSPQATVQLGGYYGINLQAGGYPIFIHQMQHEVASFNWTESHFTSSDKEVMSISSGLVAVTGNLSVSGVIHASTGTIAVPDYVFEPGYKLAPLAAVEAFTKENKHLPEVPAASELEKGGIDLAKMNLTLLKKIEELTLHAIAQEKRLESQDKSIAEMKSELRTLNSH